MNLNFSPFLKRNSVTWFKKKIKAENALISGLFSLNLLYNCQRRGVVFGLLDAIPAAKGLSLAIEGVPNAQVGKFITGGADELAESSVKIASSVDGEAVKLVDEAGSGMKLVDDAADVGFITVLRDAGLDDTKIQEIISIPKGQRPDPKTYLSPEYIQKHLAQFDDGLLL